MVGVWVRVTLGRKVKVRVRVRAVYVMKAKAPMKMSYVNVIQTYLANVVRI